MIYHLLMGVMILTNENIKDAFLEDKLKELNDHNLLEIKLRNGIF